MTPRMLITGGAGFIGTHLAEAFAGAWAIRLLDNFRRDSLRYAPALRSHPHIEIISADVLERAALDRAVAGIDTIIHLAAIAGVSSYYNEPTKTLRVNILGTANLLEAAVNAGVKRVIYFSTSEVYGPEARDVNEEMPHGIGPVSDRRWVYATSKLAGEHFTLRCGEENGIATMCVRPFNVYGPRQTGEGAISNFCSQLARAKPITVYGDGSEVRSWCYVDDLVAAVSAMLATPAAAGMSFNIGNPATRLTTRELAELAVRVAGRGSIETKESGHTPISYRSPDIGRARQILGFAPRIGIEEGLARTLAWFREVQP